MARDRTGTAARIAVLYKRAHLTGAILMAGLTSSYAQSPVDTDGDKYKVRFENHAVRVLEYKDAPGEKTHMHKHPAFLVYALSSFKRRLQLPDGKTLLREFKPGDILWSDAQAHIGENVGDTPTHIIMVEMKP